MIDHTEENFDTVCLTRPEAAVCRTRKSKTFLSRAIRSFERIGQTYKIFWPNVSTEWGAFWVSENERKTTGSWLGCEITQHEESSALSNTCYMSASVPNGL